MSPFFIESIKNKIYNIEYEKDGFVLTFEYCAHWLYAMATGSQLSMWVRASLGVHVS